MDDAKSAIKPSNRYGKIALSTVITWALLHVTTYDRWPASWLKDWRQFPYTIAMLVILFLCFCKDTRFEKPETEMWRKVVYSVLYGFIASFLGVQITEMFSGHFFAENHVLFTQGSIYDNLKYFVVFPLILGGWIYAFGIGILLNFLNSERLSNFLSGKKAGPTPEEIQPTPPPDATKPS